MKIEYIDINHNKLHDELIENGIIPILVESLENKTWITYADDTDMAAVQAIIDVHDSTPYPPQPTAEDYLIDLDYRLSLIELGI
jgi:hypothetical protein